jgi:hypothetical protein
VGDYSGVMYTAPESGKLSVTGALSGDSNTGYMVVKVNASNTVIGASLAEGSCTGSSNLIWLGGIGALQNIVLQAGESIAVLAVTPPWNEMPMMPIFDFAADPTTQLYSSFPESGDITDAEYDAAIGNAQNTDGWYYLYGSPQSSYYELVYDGARTVWSEPANAVKQQHNSAVVPSERYGAVRMWRAPENGAARITGNMTLSANSADGVTVKIFKRSYESGGVYGAAQPFNDYRVTLTKNRRFAEFNFENVEISGGDMYFFCVDSNDTATGDLLVLHTHISFTGDGTGAVTDGDIGASDPPETVSKDWYSDKQNTNGWFYMWGTPEKHMMMTYGYGDTQTPRWNGIEWNVSIEEGQMNPGSYTGVMRTYVPNRSGTFKVEGTATMLRTDGDGKVRMAIYKNTECLWEKSFTPDQRNESAAFENADAITVEKGDVLFFLAEYCKGERVAYDTRCQFEIDVECTTDGGDYDAGTDLGGYLSPVTFAEYYNVHLSDGFEDGGTQVVTPPGDGLLGGEIALIVVGAVVLLLGAGFMFLFRRKRA